MRRSASMLAAFLLFLPLSACTSGKSTEDRPERLNVTVILGKEATPPQVKEVEARLREVPDFTELIFNSREDAYVKLKETFKDQPEMLASIKREDLPEGFTLWLKNRKAFDRAHQGPLRSDLRRMTSVQEVTFTGKPAQLSMQLCVQDSGALAETPELREIAVFLTGGIFETEKQAIEDRLRNVPGANDVTLWSGKQGFDKAKTMFGQAYPGVFLPSNEKDPSDVLILTVTDRQSVMRASDEKLAEQICRLPGVDRVLVPPKPQR